MARKQFLQATALALLVCVGANAVAENAGAEPTASSAAPYNWRNVTLGGGGFAPGIVFSTVERGLAYLRTDMGGAYRWDAAQARWLPLQDDETEPSFMGIESIAPDPVDANIVYMAAGMGARMPAAIFRSADRGATWRKTMVPFAMGGNEDGRGMGERLAVDPHAHTTLLFGSRHDGLWRSDNSGAAWQKVASFPLAGLGKPDRPRVTHGGLSFVLFDPAERGRIYVASADPGAQHLFRSDDGGKSWQTIAGGPSADLLPTKGVVGRDGVLTITYCDYIGPNGIKRGEVWRFDPQKGEWRDVTPLKGAAVVPGGYMGVAVAASDPNIIAVSTVNRYIGGAPAAPGRNSRAPACATSRPRRSSISTRRPISAIGSPAWRSTRSTPTTPLMSPARPCTRLRASTNPVRCAGRPGPRGLSKPR
jgi:hypothetical protein